jgi:hypothetical protein
MGTMNGYIFFGEHVGELVKDGNWSMFASSRKIPQQTILAINNGKEKIKARNRWNIPKGKKQVAVIVHIWLVD